MEGEDIMCPTCNIPVQEDNKCAACGKDCSCDKEAGHCQSSAEQGAGQNE